SSGRDRPLFPPALQRGPQTRERDGGSHGQPRHASLVAGARARRTDGLAADERGGGPAFSTVAGGWHVGRRRRKTPAGPHLPGGLATGRAGPRRADARAV